MMRTSDVSFVFFSFPPFLDKFNTRQTKEKRKQAQLSVDSLFHICTFLFPHIYAVCAREQLLISVFVSRLL